MDYTLPVLVVAPPAAAAAAVAVAFGSPGGGLTGQRAGRLISGALGLGALAAAVLLVATGLSATDTTIGTIFLRADRTGAILALLTLAVGTTVVAWARRALVGDEREQRWYALTAALVVATATTALAGNLIVLAAGWIATSVALVALIGHRREWHRARRAQRQVALALAVGDLALVAAVTLTAVITGTVDLASPAVLADRLADHGWGLDAVAALLVVAGISRSALVPLHRWLPATLVAPTPVSAILHAGVINGAGVLLLRFAPVASGSTPAMLLLFAAGAATAVLATATMLVRADVKGTLAWSTAGQMGFMAAQLAVGAFSAALFHIVGHALYKAALFLGAGSAVEAATNERRLPKVAPVTGRQRIETAAMALVAGAATVAAVAVIGPPGPEAGTILIVVFGWLTVAQLTRGWLIGVDHGVGALAAAALTAVVAPWLYVGALGLFKAFVDLPVLEAGPGVVGPVILVATIATVAAAAAAVVWLPGGAGLALRRRLTGTLIGIGTPSDTTVWPTPATGVPDPVAVTPDVAADELAWRSTV